MTSKYRVPLLGRWESKPARGARRGALVTVTALGVAFVWSSIDVNAPVPVIAVWVLVLAITFLAGCSYRSGMQMEFWHRISQVAGDDAVDTTYTVVNTGRIYETRPALDGRLNVDLDLDGRIVGIEILSRSAGAR